MFENQGFHWRENIFWKRLTDGSVRVAFFAVRASGTPQEGDDDEPVRELIIPPAEWASIVDVVSMKRDDSSRREANLKIAFADHGIPWPTQKPITDAEAARYIAHTHPLAQQSGLTKEQLEALKPGCTEPPTIPKDMFRTIAKGLLPDGLDVSKLTPQGRQEIRDAIDRLLDALSTSEGEK